MSAPYSAADGLVRVYPAQPQASREHPPHGSALVWSHGGGFQGGDLEMPEADWVARALAARGVTVVSVAYRVATSTVHFPIPSDDVLAAYLWTRDHAVELGVDPERIVIGGASAGANLTTGVALRLKGGEGPLPAGVFLAYPTLHAVQSPTPPALQRALEAQGQAASADPARVMGLYEAYLGGSVEGASAIAIPGIATRAELAGLPPVLMINSDTDGLRVSGEAFAAALVDAGVALELTIEPGTLHGHLNRPDLPQAEASIDRVLTWLTELLAPSA